jgi:hypothetical protein
MVLVKLHGGRLNLIIRSVQVRQGGLTSAIQTACIRSRIEKALGEVPSPEGRVSSKSSWHPCLPGSPAGKPPSHKQDATPSGREGQGDSPFLNWGEGGWATPGRGPRGMAVGRLGQGMSGGNARPCLGRPTNTKPGAEKMPQGRYAAPFPFDSLRDRVYPTSRIGHVEDLEGCAAYAWAKRTV